MLDSAANARVLIIYLRDVRRTCRTFAIARASARERANERVRRGILDFAPFSCLALPIVRFPPSRPSPAALAATPLPAPPPPPSPELGLTFFGEAARRQFAMFINESQLQFQPDAHFYSGGNVTSRSRATTTTTMIRQFRRARVPRA